jgi:hypothetical protein
MRLSEMLVRMAKGETLSPAEIDELSRKAEQMEQLESLVGGWISPGSSIPFIRNLKTENIRIDSGEIILGEGNPGSGFSGMRIAFPALLYDGEYWNLVGVNNDVMQVGIRASDGKFVAASGDVIIDNEGMLVKNNTEASLSFEDVDGGRTLTLYSDLLNNLNVTNIKNDSTNGGVRLIKLFLNAANEGRLILKEGATNQALLQLENTAGTSNAGMRVTLQESSTERIGLYTEGFASGSTYAHLNETSRTPSSPTVNTDVHIYFKDNKLIFQFSESGTVRYKYLDLTGTGVTWVHTTTAP